MTEAPLTPERLDTHLVAAMEQLGEHSPRTAVVARGPDAAVAAVGVGGPPFNMGIVLAPASDPAATVRFLLDTLATTGGGFSVQVRDALLPPVADALAAAGLTLDVVMPGMALRTTADVPPLPPGVRVERVTDEAALYAHTITMGTAFGAPDPEVTVDVLVPSLLADDRAVLFNGYVDGSDEPAATAVCAVAAGVAGIYAVGTLPAARRRGVGTAVTWAAVAAGAAAGAGVAALQATEVGEPVYRRMGFENVTRYHRYVTAP